MKVLKSLSVFATVAWMTVSAWGAPAETLAEWMHRICVAMVVTGAGMS